MSAITDSEYASSASAVTRSPLAKPETPLPKDAAGKIFDEAVGLIQPNFHYAFVTSGSLRNKLLRVHKKYGDMTVHLLVKGVNEELVNAAIRSLPFRRSLRVWFESDAAIIRMIMPSPAHEITSREFSAAIRNHVAQIPGHTYQSVCGVGATRFRCPGARSKEGDDGFKCTTRSGAADWPNLMIEVGYSEPLSRLRMDARWWLEASNSLTRMVIIILVSTNPNNLHLEVWTMPANPNRRSTPASIPAMSDAIDIDAASTVTPPNGSLRIPYAVLFDNQNGNAHNIVITTAELSGLATHVFGVLR